MRRIWCFAELGAAAAYLGRRGASERGGWLQRSADWLVSSEQRAAIDFAGFVQLAATNLRLEL